MKCFAARPAAAFAFALVLSLPDQGGAAPVSFSFEVLPLLSDNCFHCHGQDEKNRKGDLRLDTREGAMKVITAGKPEASELFARLVTEDAEELMPPPKSHKPRLSLAQVDTLRRWITEGATWGKHWAFELPRKAELPGNGQAHPIDAFVQARLASEQLALAPLAPAHTLLRRLSFDLTGLPPTLEQLAAFELEYKKDAARAIATTTQALLKSPHYGERMAMWWLDAARYADTDGFQSDASRNNWPWRDWVIEAFNRNLPYDQFTLEQFAGDLLPQAKPEQVLATCFHRNHMTNGEGGRDKEESRIDYVIDRVSTTGTVWLGLTLGCAQCHSHKFDPISHADFYGLNAFFNSIDEDGAAGTAAKPYLSYQSPRVQPAIDEAKALLAQREPLEKQARVAAEVPFAAWLAAQAKAARAGFQAWHTLLGRVESAEGTVLKQQPSDGIVQASGPHPRQDDYRLITAPPKLSRITGLRLEVLPSEGRLSRGKSGEFILTDIKVQVRGKATALVRDIRVAKAVADTKAEAKAREYGDVSGTLDDDPRNGWTTKGFPQDQPHTALFALAEPLVLSSDEELVFELRQRSTKGDANITRFRVAVTDQAGPAVREIGATPLEQLAASKVTDLTKLEAKLRGRLLAQFLEDHAPYQAAKASLEIAQAQLKEATAAAGKLNVMVLAERKEPRDTHILIRGVWDKKGDKVQPSVPAAIAPWPANAARDRAGLARWLVSRDNPLTARVLVNHLWQMFFGAGLVRTPDDFGLQGQRPTHPEVLDWLATDFMEHGWDIQHLITRIVTSRTYQQSSAAEPGLITRDPQNRLLARGPRFRLPSWMLRDAALQASGLLNPTLGGPPVRPYQPDGVWEELFMGRYTYVPSEGRAQQRRTLYAFWRRSIAPTFLFDTAQRRVCEVAMTRTNTPLQALTLLNDRSMMDAAQALAASMLKASASSRTDQLQHLARRVLSRELRPHELAVLQRELDRAEAFYQAHPQDAAKYLGKPQASPALGARTVIASLVLNLDEALTHE